MERVLAKSKDAGVARYLLHGDFGFHNVLFKEGRLTGIIDPTPVCRAAAL